MSMCGRGEIEMGRHRLLCELTPGASQVQRLDELTPRLHRLPGTKTSSFAKDQVRVHGPAGAHHAAVLLVGHDIRGGQVAGASL